MLVRREDPDSYYNYDPSLGAAALFAVLYGLAFIGTVVQWLRFRPVIWLVMVISAAMEAVGYIARTVSTQDVTARTVYVLQFSLLILAPVLMAGALYVLFGRIIFLVVPKDQRTFRICWVPPRFVTPIFVGFDVIALFLQLIGAVMITSGNGTSQDDIDSFNRGRDLALIGVIVQIVAFGIFTIAAVRFNFTSKKFLKAAPQPLYPQDQDDFALQVQDKPRKTEWQSLLRVVNLSTVMILIRSIYRMVEFTEGHGGYINNHEWPFYIFDAVPIFPCVALFVYWHPSLYLPYMGFRLPKHAR
ncbi:RTA1 like protein-domain-containing protein [Aspergillus cavernicola]|uniref:RTA1 like protein-domain-containing protein n=1 Tax=Aspergillus cavernicola TaxID=176166 RepID=A0ABR4I327_9EURO